MSSSSASLTPGFIALHGNRTEDLLDALAAWLASHPLDALDNEIILTHSNAMAEWVKMALAERNGICAATRVQLPARFLWQCYRQLLPAQALPPPDRPEKLTLSWRLMRQLPHCLEDEAFAGLARWLAGETGAARRYQLARHIADLYDQYQVYRADWLTAWAAGEAVLIDARGERQPLPADQRWQAELWQQLCAADDEQARSNRARVHLQALASLAALTPAQRPPALPQRVIVFGMSHLPLATLELLAALARCCQVIIAVPNPCRYYWADIIDGRELLRASRRRQPLRDGQSLAVVSLEDMHLHAHPLLAAWGRQSRDFIRQLDAFDDAEQTRRDFALARIDLFDEGDSAAADAPLLLQIQRHIRDLRPLAEHPQAPLAADDRSVVFHLAHSPLRELEILHDQLLALLAAPARGRQLQPRDIIVMVPAIEDFAPAIRAVFGQYGRHDPRHIPFDIADLPAAADNPMLAALQWLLRLPQEDCTLAQFSALFDVAAIARRYGLADSQRPLLLRWLEGAGARWGLDETHRRGQGLAICGASNTLLFAVQRLLMGYAVGDHEAAATAPWGLLVADDEIGGLEAEVAGSAARLVDCLLAWQAISATAATPVQWAARARTLLAQLFAPHDDSEHNSLAALEAALESWLAACSSAGFDEAIDVSLFADGWLDSLDAPSLERRFRAGGVTFCTLMPMRAIPFAVVCLLGMNEEAYPRRTPANAFDLIAHPGQRRPGDRARRDDDRQLMLEALLSARQQLYVSWSAFSIRDNSPRPPSVLVAQLRDYIAAGWSPQALAARSSEHPLQAFNRAYFSPDSGLFSYAREWRSIHDDAPAAAPCSATPQESAAAPSATPTPLALPRLVRFLQNPVRSHFRERLQVVFEESDEQLADSEHFVVDGLQQHQLSAHLLARFSRHFATSAAQGRAALAAFAPAPVLQRELARLQAAGALPLATPGVQTRHHLADELLPMLQAWQASLLALPAHSQHVQLQFSHAGFSVEEFVQLHHDETGASLVWLELLPGRLLSGDSKPRLRLERLPGLWLRSLLSALSPAQGTLAPATAGGLLIARDTCVRLNPLHDAAAARAQLENLLAYWQQGCRTPLPVAIRTALAALRDENPQLCYDGSRHQHGEREEPCLARCYADFDALSADGRFKALSTALYAPLLAWADSQLECLPHSDFPARETAA